MTERFIQEKLADMAKDRSSLMIAHRLSTIVDASKIVVLENGKVSLGYRNLAFHSSS